MKKLAPFGTGLFLFSVSACSEPESPECNDYRDAEIAAYFLVDKAQREYADAKYALDEYDLQTLPTDEARRHYRRIRRLTEELRRMAEDAPNAYKEQVARRVSAGCAAPKGLDSK